MEHGIGRDEDWAAIAAKLPRNWRVLATTHGLVFQPKRGSGQKLADPGVLLRMILHHVCAGASLKVTTALAAALGLADLSGVALHKWIRKAGPWLAALVAQMLATAATFAPARWSGYEVVAADATVVTRPGATGTTARVHLALRLADLRALALKVTDATIGETLRNFAPGAGQLWLADRGYCNANSIAHAVRRGAAVLIRFAFGSLPVFDAQGRALDVRTRLATLRRVGARREWVAVVHPARGAPIVGRLVAVRLPEAQADAARARLAAERGRAKVTADARDLAAYVVLFTTVPATRLRAAALVELYRLRWQVELGFKRDKSIGELDRLPNFRADTIYAWLCAKLLGFALARRLAEPDGEPFPPSIVGTYALRPTLRGLAAAAQARHGGAA